MTRYEAVRVDDHTFDEDGYLLANPDVARSVERRKCSSGREHFDRFGVRESRFQLIPLPADRPAFGHFQLQAPSRENAFNLFKGQWSSIIPGYGGGVSDLFDDPRIKWFLQHFAASGKRILELGPLEGGHTYLLSEAGAEVVSIEANAGAYLKCLVTKEELGFKARILHGDFIPYVEQTSDRYDAVVASGVLYHLLEPVAFLRNVVRISNTVYLWTHYYERVKLRELGLLKKFAAQPSVLAGVEHWEQRYMEARDWAGFSGGTSHSSSWLTREGLLDTLHSLGFKTHIEFEEMDHPNGPALAILGTR